MDRGKLVKQAWGKFHDARNVQHTAMVSMYEFSPNYFTVYLDRTQPSLPLREGQVMGGTRALAEERYGHFVVGQSQGNPNERNQRNKLIATIWRNRANAERLGHRGVKPVSQSDLIELNNMSTADLEQTAKLTWQLTMPVVKQPEGELGEREKWIREYIRQQINGMVFGSELEKQHAIEQARRKAEAYLMGQSQGNPQKTTVHGYRYEVRYWEPGSRTPKYDEVLAAYKEDLHKEMERLHPGAHWTVVRSKPVLGY